MRALGLLAAILVTNASSTWPERPAQTAELLPLDEATLLAWGSWARRDRDEDSGSAAPARREPDVTRARQVGAGTPAVSRD